MKVIVDNLATEYSDSGSGKTLLLLHGWGDSSHTFDELIERLGDPFRIVRLDLPGFGATQMPNATWDISKYAKFVSDFCEKLELNPDVIIGHSFGGRISIKGLSTGKLRSNKLVLIGSAGIAKTKSARNILIKIAAKIFGIITYIPPLLFYRERLRRKLYQAIGSDYLDAGIMRDTYLAAIREDLQKDATNISIPALLIWGENDTATPIADGKKLSEHIKGSRLEIIPAATHFVHREKPEIVARLIKEFVQ